MTRPEILPEILPELAGALLLAARSSFRKRALISGSVNPLIVEAAQMALEQHPLEIEALAPDPIGIEDLLGRLDPDLACLVIENPSLFGRLQDLSSLKAACHALGILLVVIPSHRLAALERDADIVVTESVTKYDSTLAERLEGRAHAIAAELISLGRVRILPDHFLHRFALLLPIAAAPLAVEFSDCETLAIVPAAHLYPSYPELENVLLLTVTADSGEGEVGALLAALSGGITA